MNNTSGIPNRTTLQGRENPAGQSRQGQIIRPVANVEIEKRRQACVSAAGRQRLYEVIQGERKVFFKIGENEAPPKEVRFVSLEECPYALLGGEHAQVFGPDYIVQRGLDDQHNFMLVGLPKTRPSFFSTFTSDNFIKEHSNVCVALVGSLIIALIGYAAILSLDEKG